MKHRRWIARTLVGLALGIGLGASPGCTVREDDEFADRLAEQLCSLRDRCGFDFVLPGDSEPVSTMGSCEAAVRDHYEQCGDRCDFSRTRARRCLRRIDRIELDDCPDGHLVLPLVCDDVYSECEGESCPAPIATCAVTRGSGPAGSVLALGLLVLGGWSRRRRRSSATKADEQ